jgi:hypothetical protein
LILLFLLKKKIATTTPKRFLSESRRIFLCSGKIY